MDTTVTTVLLVDDHTDSLEMYLYAFGLLSIGFQPMTAASAEEAYARALQLRPDVVVTDLTLLGASGIDLARRLRDAPETSETAIIVLTGHGGGAGREEAREPGCDRVLLKPIQVEELSLVIREVLAARRPSLSAAGAGG